MALDGARVGIKQQLVGIEAPSVFRLVFAMCAVAVMQPCRGTVEKAMEDAVIRAVQTIAFQFGGAIIGIQTKLDGFGTLRKDREVDAAFAGMRAQWRIPAGLKAFGQDVHGEGTRNTVDSGGRVTANERA